MVWFQTFKNFLLFVLPFYLQKIVAVKLYGDFTWEETGITYKILLDGNWDECLDYCEELEDYEFTSIRTQEEFEWINSNILVSNKGNFGLLQPIWIGLRLVNGEETWSDGTDYDITPKPTIGGLWGECIDIKGGGYWIRDLCGTNFQCMCKQLNTATQPECYDCSVSCGGGTQTCVSKILQPGTIVVCPSLEERTEISECNTQECKKINTKELMTTIIPIGAGVVGIVLLALFIVYRKGKKSGLGTFGTIKSFYGSGSGSLYGSGGGSYSLGSYDSASSGGGSMISGYAASSGSNYTASSGSNYTASSGSNYTASSGASRKSRSTVRSSSSSKSHRSRSHSKGSVRSSKSHRSTSRSHRSSSGSITKHRKRPHSVDSGRSKKSHKHRSSKPPKSINSMNTVSTFST